MPARSGHPGMADGRGLVRGDELEGNWKKCTDTYRDGQYIYRFWSVQIWSRWAEWDPSALAAKTARGKTCAQKEHLAQYVN